MAHQKMYTPAQLLAILTNMDDCESDGGDEAPCTLDDSSDASSEDTCGTSDEENRSPPAKKRKADKTPAPRAKAKDGTKSPFSAPEGPTEHAKTPSRHDEDTCGTSDEENRSPTAKKRKADKTPAPRVKAKDGTVWEKVDIEPIRVSGSTKSTFSAPEEPTEHAKRRITSRLQSFLCLVDMQMLMILADCTVHEARRTDNSWSLSISELMAFIAVLFLRATLCPVGAQIECWSEKYAVPAIKETMSRDRYKEIMRYLRFDDKGTRAERVKTDRFAAISDIWQRFIKNCNLCYTPGQHITVDEQLFPTKVRCPFIQYIASKPDKFGIKFWIASDLKTKYMCNSIPYLGKDPSRPKGERVSENVVMKLMEPYLGKGRTVTTDNYFTSLSLANRLTACNTTLLGTINSVRREIPLPVKNAKGREVFSTQVYRSGDAILTVYAPKKNKTVCVLSTMHQQVKISDSRKRKPNTITDYNLMKCGVDQKVRAYTVRAGTRRWPVAVFYNLLDLAAMNAHVLYTACTGSTESRRDFVHSLAGELRHRLLQEKAMSKMQRPLPAPGKKTQCQVQSRCNRNHSTEQCAACGKYTCRKCRKEGPWLCSKC
ncbi:hypothetical protein SRHO_G00147220 [Serrasalmus rhombeus]